MAPSSEYPDITNAIMPRRGETLTTLRWTHRELVRLHFIKQLLKPTQANNRNKCFDKNTILNPIPILLSAGSCHQRRWRCFVNFKAMMDHDGIVVVSFVSAIVQDIWRCFVTFEAMTDHDDIAVACFKPARVQNISHDMEAGRNIKACGKNKFGADCCSWTLIDFGLLVAYILYMYNIYMCVFSMYKYIYLYTY